MKSTNPAHRRVRALRFIGLSLVVALTTAYLLASATGRCALPDPPSYPDEIHVLNGCRLSTARYLERFRDAFPDEHGEVLNIRMPDAGQNHAVALVTWHGQLWCRDEYFGVFPLECSVEARPRRPELADRAEDLLARQAARLIHKEGAPRMRLAREPISAGQLLQEVALAVRIIPFPTTLFWIRSGDLEVPLIFFRPTSERVAVYDPLHGTCLAKCACHDDAKVVSQIAAELGYSVDAIRTG